MAIQKTIKSNQQKTRQDGRRHTRIYDMEVQTSSSSLKLNEGVSCNYERQVQSNGEHLPKKKEDQIDITTCP